MKKYFIFLIGLSLLVGSLAVVNLVRADTAPITANVSKDDLRQSLSIKEIPGRAGKITCLSLDCPSATSSPSTKPSNEVLIKAAKVTEISTNLLKVSIFGYLYKIDVANSKIVRHWWGNSSIDEFSVGDVVNVLGYLDASDNYLVHAKTIRNVSIQKMYGVFKGTIESIASTSTEKSFVLKTEERGNQTVIVSDSTKIITATTTGSFSGLQVGLPVVVRGIWNKTLSKIQAQIVIMGRTADTRPFFQKNSSLIKELEEKLKEPED